MKRYEIKHQPTLFGRDEVKKRTFKKVETDKKIWYIPVQDNAADDLHVQIKGEGSQLGSFQGYGGATLEFLLEDGTIDKVKGPWHSNSISLLADTGIDLTKRTMTIGAIGKDRTFEGNTTFLEDVLYEDTDWVVGDFNRIKEMAQEFADDLGIKVWYYSQTNGGSSTCWLDPTGVDIPFPQR